MSVATLLSHPVTLKYRAAGAKDAYGQPSVTVTEEDSFCYARMMTTDDADAVSREQIDYKVYLPATTVTTGLFALVLDGLQYDIQGPAHHQYNPRLARVEYVVVTARRAAS